MNEETQNDFELGIPIEGTPIDGEKSKEPENLEPENLEPENIEPENLEPEKLKSQDVESDNPGSDDPGSDDIDPDKVDASTTTEDVSTSTETDMSNAIKTEIAPDMSASEDNSNGIEDYGIASQDSDSVDLTLLKLDSIQGQLDSLHDEFDDKIKTDQYKNQLIDNLHKELQEYKNDIIKKHLQSIVMDIIKVIDDIRKLSDHYTSKTPEEIDVKKILNLLERIPADLEDIFYWQGIKSFTCDSIDFDAKRQRVMKKIKTNEIEKDKKIAASLRPGYEWDGRVIRPEMVAVNVYTKDQNVT